LHVALKLVTSRHRACRHNITPLTRALLSRSSRHAAARVTHQRRSAYTSLRRFSHRATARVSTAVWRRLRVAAASVARQRRPACASLCRFSHHAAARVSTVPPCLRVALLWFRSVASHITPPRVFAQCGPACMSLWSFSHHDTVRAGKISPRSRVALSLLVSRRRACSASASPRLRVALQLFTSRHRACLHGAALLIVSRAVAAHITPQRVLAQCRFSCASLCCFSHHATAPLCLRVALSLVTER